MTSCPECGGKLDPIINASRSELIGHYCVSCKLFVKVKDAIPRVPTCAIGVYSNDEHGDAP